MKGKKGKLSKRFVAPLLFEHSSVKIAIHCRRVEREKSSINMAHSSFAETKSEIISYEVEMLESVMKIMRITPNDVSRFKNP